MCEKHFTTLYTLATYIFHVLLITAAVRLYYRMRCDQNDICVQTIELLIGGNI